MNLLFCTLLFLSLSLCLATTIKKSASGWAVTCGVTTGTVGGLKVKMTDDTEIEMTCPSSTQTPTFLQTTPDNIRGFCANSDTAVVIVVNTHNPTKPASAKCRLSTDANYPADYTDLSTVGITNAYPLPDDHAATTVLTPNSDHAVINCQLPGWMYETSAVDYYSMFKVLVKGLAADGATRLEKLYDVNSLMDLSHFAGGTEATANCVLRGVDKEPGVSVQAFLPAPGTTIIPPTTTIKAPTTTIKAPTTTTIKAPTTTIKAPTVSPNATTTEGGLSRTSFALLVLTPMFLSLVCLLAIAICITRFITVRRYGRLRWGGGNA